MKKFVYLCLMLSLLVACSSEKNAKPAPAAAPTMENVAATEAPAPITSLSGEYVLTETNATKTKPGGQEFTCQTTHTYKLMFINDNMVRYMANTEQSIDPPAEGMMCQSKLYHVDETGTYEIKDGRSVKMTFSAEEKKMPWVHNNVMILQLNNINSLEIFHNGAKFLKQ